MPREAGPKGPKDGAALRRSVVAWFVPPLREDVDSFIGRSPLGGTPTTLLTFSG